MQTEILNIEWHIKRMVLKALNNSKTVAIASKKLGVTDRQLYLYKNQFCIKKCKQTKVYSIVK